MFKSAIPSILNRSLNIISKGSGTETQRLLSSMIYDDEVNVLTTFDMNRIASYTFGETICGEIFDLLEDTLRNPQNFSVLSLHKVLVLVHHLSIYASQKAANAVWILKPHIKPLLEYNTVLIAHNDPKSVLSRIQRIKGGSVDRGQPVRDAAKVLYDLLSDVELFRKIRASSADPDSLVPVGHHEEVAFVSDNVKKAMLEEKMQKQHMVDIKSNLKGNGGFGAGGGSNVIGAAHSMEEMLKMAMKDKVGYKDGDLSENEKAHYEHLQTLRNELKMKKASGLTEDGSVDVVNGNNNNVADLLDFGDDNEDQKYTSESGMISTTKSLESLPYKGNSEDPYILDSIDGTSANDDIFGTTANELSSGPVLDQFTSASTSTSLQNNAEISHDMDLLSMTMGGMAVHDNSGTGPMLQKETSVQSPFDPINSTRTESSVNIATGYGMGGLGHIATPAMGASNYTQSRYIAFDDLSSGTAMPTPTHTLPHFPQSTQAPIPPELPSMPPPNQPPPPPPMSGGTTEDPFQSISYEKKKVNNAYPDGLNPFSD